MYNDYMSSLCVIKFGKLYDIVFIYIAFGGVDEKAAKGILRFFRKRFCNIVFLFIGIYLYWKAPK
jgi:hypothetical protein